MIGALPTLIPQAASSLAGNTSIPSFIADAGEPASHRFLEYFTATIRNPNTREVYYHAVRRFCDWCSGYDLTLTQLSPVMIATYIEELRTAMPRPFCLQGLSLDNAVQHFAS